MAQKKDLVKPRSGMTLLHFRGRTKVHFAGPRTKGPGQCEESRLWSAGSPVCLQAGLPYQKRGSSLRSE